MKRIAWVGLWMAAVAASGCGGRAQPEAAPSPEVPAAARFEALPDTLVCVVDRTTERGLRDLPAKQRGDEVVVLVGGEIRPLADLHPVNLIAGYAGREPWFTGNEPVTLQGRRYRRYGGERRVPLESLRRVGEFQVIPLFGSPEDPSPPPAVYVPVRAGCIFQPYVREDLLGATG